MRRALPTVPAIALLLAAAAPGTVVAAPAGKPAPPVDEALVIVSNGETVGSLAVHHDGARARVTYRVDDNGRGPKHVEDIVFSPAGVPLHWAIDGTSLMGGAVAERYDHAAGVARWHSQADSGEVPAAAPPLYIANDDSPYALAIYARAAMAAPDHCRAVLPSGRVCVEQVRKLALQGAKGNLPVTAWRVSGVQLNPGYVLLDGANRLAGVFGPGAEGTTVRAGFEAAVPALGRLATELETERALALQARLAHRVDGPLRIRNVRVFDPDSGTLSAPSSIVVMRDTITQVIAGDTAPAPDDETVIDGEGGTVYPGLHDMHSHATLPAGLLYLAAGVTATRDMGNDNAFLQDLLTRIDAGTVAWPRIVPNGFIEGRSPYSARFGFIPDTLDAALGNVRWYADRGYAEIKIYNSMNPAWIAPIAAEAHRLGLRVTGHVPAFTTPDRVIADGYDSIAHINQLMLGWILRPDEDSRTPLRLTAMARAGSIDLASAPVTRTIGLMQQHHVALDTTASILEQLMLSRAGQVPPGQEDFLGHMPVGFQRYRRRSFVQLPDAATDAAYHSGFAKVLETIGTLHKAGIALLPGTDEATGFAALRELELYVAAGLTPAQALRAGTLDCERFFGREDRLGTIARGKLADFVLVAGDPTRDIAAIRRPRMVLRGGTVYFPAEIHAALGITPFTTPPAIQPARTRLAQHLDGLAPAQAFGYEIADHAD